MQIELFLQMEETLRKMCTNEEVRKENLKCSVGDFMDCERLQIFGSALLPDIYRRQDISTASSMEKAFVSPESYISCL